MVGKYKDYIKDEQWLEKSAKYLEENPMCEICHKHKANQAHHNSYENFGEETDDDLTAICDRCHFHLHTMPPMIEDPIQLKKAINLMADFRNYPRLKTLILNEISSKYFDGKYMIDVASEVCSNTAFMPQNLMEIFYEKGLEIGKDIIEDAVKIGYVLKMQAGKNYYLSTKDELQRKKAFENGETEIVNTYLTTTKKPERTKEEILAIVKKQWIFTQIKDKTILARAKSFANINYYKGAVYFNQIGIFTPEQFYLKLRNDGFIDKFFEDMGGTVEMLEKEAEKLVEN